MKFLKGFTCLILAVVLMIGTVGVNLTASAQVTATQTASNTVNSISKWSGQASTGFAGGTGTKEDPYIIETADQLYLALTKVTDTTNDVTGGKQTSKIFKQSSTTEYVPVYTPYYYKIADGVKAIYLNDIEGSETLEGIKAYVAGSSKKTWNTNKSFVGNLDGNGVTIYGMYSANGQGFIKKIDGSATIKNFNFDSCYSKGSGLAAIVTTQLGAYTNDSTIETLANITVRNCYIESTRNVTLNDSCQYSPGAAGLVSTTSTAEELTIANSLFDGYSCEVVQGKDSHVITPGNYVSTLGGIISGGHSMNNVTLIGCVSLGAPAVDEIYIYDREINYTRYDKNQGFQVYFYSNYTDFPTTLCDNYPGKYDKLLDISRLEVKDTYTLIDLPELNWSRNWELKNVNGRIIPMSKNNPDVDAAFGSYAQQIAKQNNDGGAYSVFAGAYIQGEYGMYHQLMGAGTEDDPYLINNAFELARAIASGGVNSYNKLHYKLTCDIDASGATWITQDKIPKSNSVKYLYVPFSGVLDGDGHTVYNVYCGDDQATGIVPVLAENGVVKNLHVRDSAFVSGEAGAGGIAGETAEGSVIEGCSVENSQVLGKVTKNEITSSDNATVKNSYSVSYDGKTTTYYDTEGKIGDIDVAKNSDVWYLGGKTGSTPRLINYAQAREYADVDGDGKADQYGATDLVAIRRRLLLQSGYENLYCDINRNGVINIADLAVLNRSIVGDYDKLYDGFWRNVEIGNVNIYYGENDNYDAARRLEIYLESKFENLDVKKVVSAQKTVSGTNSDKDAVYVHENDLTGAPTGVCEIIVGNIENYDAYSANDLEVNDYSIKYDEENCVLWFNGGSFTGVEQAVIDFIEKADEKTSTVYTVETATLADEKKAKTVMVDTNYDGKADTKKVMYYAWGDEFDGARKDAAAGENAEISIDTWNHSTMNTESVRGTGGTYRNVEGANMQELSNLYWVENGKLKITRGVKASHATATSDFLGYVRLENQTSKDAFGGEIDDEDVIANPGLIKTNHSFLWKQGYAEMYGSLPSDGHTFASWWMLGHGVLNNFAMDESLYGKVYKLNNKGEYAYDGTSAHPLSTDPKTFKYQVPSNHFEIDIWELMQHCSLTRSSIQKTRTTGSYDYRLYLNVHKFYSVGSRNQSVVNVIDWDNPGTPRAVMQKAWFGSDPDDYHFSTSAQYLDFTSGDTTRYSTVKEKDWLGREKTYVTAEYVEGLQTQLTAPRRYGFYWSTNGVDKFNFTLYIYDINGDGVEGDDAILGTSKMTYNTENNNMKPSNYDCVNDAEVANQYMYFLIDNVLYTSNTAHNNATSDLAVMFTDFLTNEGTQANPDKIDMDMDYVRVYQYDGRRDIITRETENFNNGNHFGY